MSSNGSLPIDPGCRPRSPRKISHWFTAAKRESTPVESHKPRATSLTLRQTLSLTSQRFKRQHVVRSDVANNLGPELTTTERSGAPYVVHTNEQLESELVRRQRRQNVAAAAHYWPRWYWENMWQTNPRQYFDDRAKNGVFCRVCENLHYDIEHPLLKDGGLCHKCSKTPVEQRAIQPPTRQRQLQKKPRPRHVAAAVVRPLLRTQLITAAESAMLDQRFIEARAERPSTSLPPRPAHRPLNLQRRRLGQSTRAGAWQPSSSSQSPSSS